MRLRFWYLPGSKAIPGKVRRQLELQFHLDPQVIDDLGYVQQYGHYAGRQVRFIRIFDPSRVSNGGRSIHTYNDLSSHRLAILFDGYIDKDGSVHLTDRRGAANVGPE